MTPAYLNWLKAQPLASIIESGPAFDALPGAVYDLQAELEANCPAGDFLRFCRARGLNTGAVEQALADRAEQLTAAREPGPGHRPSVYFAD